MAPMLNALENSNSSFSRAAIVAGQAVTGMRKTAVCLGLGVLGYTFGCSSPQTCAPQPGYPAYPAYPASYSGYGAPGVTVPAGATMPVGGTMPAGVMPAGAVPAGTPMAGVTAPVYGQPIPGAGYPATGAAMPPGYAQPMVGR